MSCLRVSTLEAAQELLQHLASTKVQNELDAIRQLRAGPSDVAKLDYEGALELIAICGTDSLRSRSGSPLLDAASAVIAHERPMWRLAIPKGREWCRNAMDEDSAQFLERAGAWDASPGEEVVRWWDALAAGVRGEADTDRMETGREGERLTLRFEQSRLKAMGLTNLSPTWVSLEDNSLGYDILSWDRDSNAEVHALRIEAKAFRHRPGKFFLSRHEWEVAQSFASEFRFDIWCVDALERTQLSVDDVGAIVPIDKPGAKWQQLLVAV